MNPHFAALPIRFASCVAALSLLRAMPASAASFTVSTSDDTGPGSLRQAIIDANAVPGSTITFDAGLGVITLGSALPKITAPVSIDGGIGNSIDGAVNFRIFFVSTPNQTDTVTIRNLLLSNGSATGSAGVNGGASNGGGGGGGGGLGAGGGLFIDKGNVTLDGIQFNGSRAVGGRGGFGSSGMSGVAGGRGGAAPNGTLGGAGGPLGTNGTSGAFAAGGGGGGGGAGGTDAGHGAMGGFGAGGGGGGDDGNPFFYEDGNGAPGGTFGGPGGPGQVAVGGGEGGGGAALGAAVFVTPGATLVLTNTGANAGQLQGGQGAFAGQTAGSAFFLAGPTTFSVTSGTRTVSGTIADTTTDGFQRADLTKTGAGTLAFGAANTYSGTTTVQAGTLLANNTSGSATGSGSVVIQTGATLGGTGTMAPSGTNLVSISGTLAPGANAPGTMAINNGLLLSADSNLFLRIGGATPGDGAAFYSQANMTNAGASITLDSAATLTLDFTAGFVPQEGAMFFLLTRADSVPFANSFAGAPEGSLIQFEGISGQITYQANWTGSVASSSFTGGNDVAFLVVPEPSVAWLLALAAFPLQRRRRLA